MLIAERELDGVPVLAPDRALRTAADAAALDARLRAHLETGGSAIVVDCVSVTTLASPAVRVLLRASQRLSSRGGALVLLRLGESVRRALAVSGFDRDFALAAEEAEVLLAIRAGAGGPLEEVAAAVLGVMGEAARRPLPDAAASERLRATAESLLALLGSPPPPPR